MEGFLKKLLIPAVCSLLALQSFAAPETIKCVAHRGEEFAAPEASRPAFELAMKLKADIIKLDVQSTKDGVVVVSHDKTLKRTMNWNVKIKDVTLAEIKSKGVFVPVGGYKNEKLLTLQEALNIVKTAPEFWLDPKDAEEKTVDKAIEIMLKNQIKPQQIMVATFSQKVLIYVKAKYPAIRLVKHLGLRKVVKGKYTGKLSGNVKPHLFKNAAAVTKGLLAEQKELGLYGVNIPRRIFADGFCNAEELQKLRQHQLWSAIYFVHDAPAAEYACQFKPDAFVTGSIEKVRPYCKKEK